MTPSNREVEDGTPGGHTPGPWTWVEGERLSHDAEGWQVWSVAPAIVAECGEPVVEDAEGIAPANARLIAAAPCLLEALKAQERATAYAADLASLSEDGTRLTESHMARGRELISAAKELRRAAISLATGGETGK